MRLPGRAALLLSTLLLGCSPVPVSPPPAARLSVAFAGDGSGRVSSTPANVISCGPACLAIVARGTELTLQATPDPGSTFDGWFDGCSGTAPCKLTINGDTQVNALFRGKFSTISVTLAGDGEGRIVSEPRGIDCGTTCSASFRHSTPVRLSPSSTVDSYFSHWVGGGCTTGTCQVLPEEVSSVQAVFTRL